MKGIVTRMRRPFTEWISRYGIAFVTVTIAILADIWLKSLLGKTFLFLPLAATAITAIFSGYGPGVFSVLLALFALDLFVLGPTWSITPPSFSFGLRVSVFFPAGLIVAWVGGKL